MNDWISNRKYSVDLCWKWLLCERIKIKLAALSKIDQENLYRSYDMYQKKIVLAVAQPISDNIPGHWYKSMNTSGCGEIRWTSCWVHATRLCRKFSFVFSLKRQAYNRLFEENCNQHKADQLFRVAKIFIKCFDCELLLTSLAQTDNSISKIAIVSSWLQFYRPKLLW